MTIEQSGHEELEFQIGDMNGVAFEEEDLIGCDKPHHFERSAFHQPNHLKHKVKHIRSVPAVAKRIPECLKKHIKRSGK